MKFRKINEEVFYADSELILLNKKSINELEAIARKAKRKRSRVCTHKDEHDTLQEMFIIHFKDTYVKPHSHKTKVESFHVISGTANILIFDDAGVVQEKIELGDFNSGKNFYYRIGPNIIHSLIITSAPFIFHESTLGPFNREDTIFPTWAPNEENSDHVQKFLNKCKE